MPSPIKVTGGLENWNVYKKAAIACDVTEFFITSCLPPSRTVDQMRQAARSGKQNIVEGLTDNTVSFEICYKLLGVAKGSLRELREDYQDFIRQNRMALWPADDNRTLQWRKALSADLDIIAFTDLCRRKRPEVIANVMVTLTRQLDTALTKTMSDLLSEFERTGGIKEKLSQIRRTWRQKNLGY